MWLRKEDVSSYAELSEEDAFRYLRGETIDQADNNLPEKKWCLVLHEGQPLGFAIVQNGRLKNKMDPGWRIV